MFKNKICNFLDGFSFTQNFIFVKCKIINNRISFTSVLIEGPEERQFSYGSDFGPFEAKNKNLPAGTRIYKVGADGKKKELLQISSWDKGRQLKLF